MTADGIVPSVVVEAAEARVDGEEAIERLSELGIELRRSAELQRGPTFWSENDCTYRLGLELEQEFPFCVHYELPVAKWTFADFDKATDKQERVDLVVSNLHDFVEDETSQQRFRTHEHELFVEVKYLPAGCRKTYRFDHEAKVPAALADAARLARHLARRHCLCAAVLVVDDDGLFEELYDPIVWPVEVTSCSPTRRRCPQRAARPQHRACDAPGLRTPAEIREPAVQRRLRRLAGRAAPARS